MSARIASLLAAGAAIAAAQPAMADDHLPEMEHETVWIDEGDVWAKERHVDVAYESDMPRAPQGYRWVRKADYDPAAAPRYAYSEADREAWLADCTIMLSERQVDWDDYYEDDVDGDLIGGLLGAIVGGVAGNRIADGDRLAGTLIGGGIGGIAGAVIGSVIDGEDDDDDYETFEVDPYAAEYCAAYLRRYEAQGMSAIAGHGGAYHTGHRMMVMSHTAPVDPDATYTRRTCNVCEEEVVEIEEEFLEEPVAARAIPPRPQPVRSKRIPIK